ncbi:hypothetical protein IEO21_04481 [Rhodonia placenta]|uniref:Uncharacterized protein n=1 Tax=Rhodonia placenta TaxID=104341 RepID=A0A8H7P3R6_9APHY|nr:hypothetical protein IEO21_04481 [Postia placenta]
MAGANYMGGKRNAAKARAKDSIGNAQRSFFGKQKLGILTKGLSKSYNRNSGENAVPSSRGLPEISLAHAHRDLSSRMEPGVIGLSTPRKHGQTRPVKPQEDTSSSGPRGKSSGSRSKILRALDMSEPIFMKAEMERICNIPNLAGLAPDAERCFETKSIAQVNLRTPSSPTEPDWNDSMSPSYEGPGSPSQELNKYDGRELPGPLGSPDFGKLAYTELDFEPMPLDSSPVDRFDDSGFVELNVTPNAHSTSSRSWIPLAEPQSTRWSFYDHTDRSSLPEPRTPERKDDLVDIERHADGTQDSSMLGYHGSISSSISRSAVSVTIPWAASSPSRLELPPPLLLGKFSSPQQKDSDAAESECLFMFAPCASMSRPGHARSSTAASELSMSLEPGSLTTSEAHAYASDCSDCSASRSPSPGLGMQRYLSIAVPTSLFAVDPMPQDMEEESLHDALGGQLFDGADPWRALDTVLDLKTPRSAAGASPLSPRTPQRSDASTNVYGLSSKVDFDCTGGSSDVKLFEGPGLLPVSQHLIGALEHVCAEDVHWTQTTLSEDACLVQTTQADADVEQEETDDSFCLLLTNSSPVSMSTKHLPSCPVSEQTKPAVECATSHMEGRETTAIRTNSVVAAKPSRLGFESSGPVEANANVPRVLCSPEPPKFDDHVSQGGPPTSRPSVPVDIEGPCLFADDIPSEDD